MSLRIVIADDAPFVREILRNYLEKLGYYLVGEAEDGAKAVDLVLEKKPDLVLMDIVMPVKSGIEATREILAKMPRVLIVACSTVDQESVMLEALEAGCCSYIVKPFESKDLAAVIEAAKKESHKDVK